MRKKKTTPLPWEGRMNIWGGDRWRGKGLSTWSMTKFHTRWSSTKHCLEVGKLRFYQPYCCLVRGLQTGAQCDGIRRTSYQHLDFQFPVSGIVREWIFVVLSHSAWDTLLWQPQETRIACNKFEAFYKRKLRYSNAENHSDSDIVKKWETAVGLEEEAQICYFFKLEFRTLLEQWAPFLKPIAKESSYRYRYNIILSFLSFFLPLKVFATRRKKKT